LLRFSNAWWGKIERMKALSVLFATALALAASGAVAGAYTPPPQQQEPGGPPQAPAPPPMQEDQAPPPTPAAYEDNACGAWQGDTWVANGSCPATVYRHQILSGTIVAVKGHLVTVQQTGGTAVVDDTQALSNQSTGRVAVGRQVVAHGYWLGGNFYATALTTGQPPP
jgi:hypothetical protein